MKLRSILAAAAPLLFIVTGLPAGAEPGADPPRFAVNAQVIQDNHTHLLWTRCPIGMRWVSSMCVEHVHRFLYREAVAFVKQVQAASPGWRLPTREEMKTLLSADGHHLVDNELFSDLTDSECYYWTSTPFKALDGSNEALYYMGDFAFDGGTKNNEYFGHDDERTYGCAILVGSK
jgi:hypothetical protein